MKKPSEEITQAGEKAELEFLRRYGGIGGIGFAELGEIRPVAKMFAEIEQIKFFLDEIYNQLNKLKETK